MAQPSIAQQAAGQGAVAQQLQTALLTQRDQALVGAAVEQGVLHLRADQRNARVQNFAGHGGVEVGQTEVRDFAFAAQIAQDAHGFHIARLGQVPPVKLHQVQLVYTQPFQRAVDDLGEVGAVARRQSVVVGHAFGVHLKLGGQLRVCTPKLANQGFHADVVVGTVKGGEPGFDKGGHVANGLGLVDLAVAARQVPAAFDQSGRKVGWSQLGGGNAHGFFEWSCGDVAKGSAVTAAWLNCRVPQRLMTKRALQFGSGQATRASVLIQSLGWQGRCLAGKMGSSAARV